MDAPVDFPRYGFTLSPSGSLRFVSPSWSELTGYQAPDVLGEVWFEQLAPEDQLRQAHNWRDWLASTDSAYETDLNYCLCDGSPLPVHLTLHRNSELIQGYLTPMPLIRQQHEHIRQLEARLEALFRTNSQSIVILDLNHHILDYNQTAHETSRLRFQREMQRGECFTNYVQPDRMDDFYESFQQVLQGRHVFKERVIYAPDRQGYAYEMAYSPILDTRGQIEGVCFTMVNIEQQRQMQLLLNHEQSFVTSILNTTNALLLVVDRQGQIVRFNKACERITGYSSDEVRDSVLWDLLIPEERERVRHLYAQICTPHGSADKQISQVQYRLRDRSGESHFISWSLSLIQGLREDALYIVATGIDVTERLAAEQALQESEAMLRQAQKMEAIGQFAGGIAHDFNNMLTAIMGYGQLLEQSVSPDSESREYLDEILNMCYKAREMTRQLLMFSRKAPAESRPVQLSQVLRQMQGLIRQLLTAKIQLVFEAEPELEHGPGWIQANTLHLEQVIMNLVVNARDAMSEGGVLRIATRRQHLEAELHDPLFGVFGAGDYLCISVADTGIGMSDETRRHLFDPFFTTKERGKGTGLGLAVVYRIVREFGGWVDVSSLPGQGSTFELFFPMIQELPPQPPVCRLVLYQVAEAEHQRICHSLSDFACQIEQASQAEQLAQLFDQPDPPRLLITPLRQPRRNGQSQLLQIHPQLKVLYLAGDSPEEMDQLDSLGQREDVLLAPFSPQQLRVRIQRML